MKNKLLVVLIDALRYDYITSENTPFIYSILNNSKTGRVIPSFGFEPDAAYLSGLQPDESNTCAQYFLDKINSPFKICKYLPNFFDALPELPSKIVRKLLNQCINILNASELLNISNIPIKLLPYFNQTFKYRMDDTNYLNGKKTIFHQLRENKFNYFIHSLPSNVDIDVAVDMVKNSPRLKECNFAFIFVGNLDVIGHKYGPKSLEIKTELRKVDKGIREIINEFENGSDGVDYLIFGDHGMIEVDDEINILEELKNTEFILGEDYITFVDSTMIRFWFYNKEAKTFFNKLMHSKNYGYIIEEELKKKYSLNFQDNRFGELIFVLKPGKIFFPNYYQKRKSVKGMHGYLPDNKDQQAFYMFHQSGNSIANNDNIDIAMVDINKMILNNLNIS